MSLLFVPGQRPQAAQVAALVAKLAAPGAVAGSAQLASGVNAPAGASPPSPLHFTISHRPAGDEWLELLASGMTYELTGLSPGRGNVLPANAHFLGLDPAIESSPLEAIGLHPGPHLAGGEGLLPVVRATAALGAALAALPGVRAVSWHAARSWVGAVYFVHAIDEWLGGGAFPALGLTALVRGDDGSFTSEGLALLIGQEVRVEPGLARKASRRPGAGRGGRSANPDGNAGASAGTSGNAGGEAASARLALRAIHSLVLSGAVTAPVRLTGPEGEPLRAEPSADQRLVHVRREG